MTKTLAILTLLYSLAGAALAQASAAASSPLGESSERTIGYNTMAEALAAVRAHPKARLVSDLDWTTYQISKLGQPDYELWTFSPASHAAHPSAVKRTVREQAGKIVVDMDVACDAPKPACDEMVRSFIEMNAKFQQSLNTLSGR